MQPGDWIAAGTLLATCIGAFFIWRQIVGLREQVTLQHFSDYTKRFHEIELHLPEDVMSDEFSLAGRADYGHVMRYMRAYFDLCFEEWFLHNRKLVDTRIWEVWQGGMITSCKRPAARQAWEIVKRDVSFSEDFQGFIDNCMAMGRPSPPAAP